MGADGSKPRLSRQRAKQAPLQRQQALSPGNRRHERQQTGSSQGQAARQAPRQEATGKQANPASPIGSRQSKQAACSKEGKKQEPAKGISQEAIGHQANKARPTAEPARVTTRQQQGSQGQPAQRQPTEASKQHSQAGSTVPPFRWDLTEQMQAACAPRRGFRRPARSSTAHHLQKVPPFWEQGQDSPQPPEPRNGFQATATGGGAPTNQRTQAEPQWIVAQRLLSALTIPGSK